MITLPNECYYQIFSNHWYYDHNYHRDLFSCSLVNRHWCKVIMPILWTVAGQHFNNIKLIRTLLLTLNAEEQTLLIPFKNILPNGPKPLFEYTSYITMFSDHDLNVGIKNWLHYKRYEIEYDDERCKIKNVNKCSWIAMLLRTGKNIKYLILDE
ncbi:f-box domain-containing protein [Gigaspora margarita]|uniref:F-box domain-containing protein n=1 Tax=Gigaspora margarita TaxID=4874 RepID=A0A8H4B5P4_GIGMA|nr:f-box domain-containing protein [Gigaspora margarita]